MGTAVATRPPVAALCRPAAPARAPSPGVAATLVQHLSSPAGMAALRGRHLLQVHGTLMDGEINNGDVIDVDFDVRRIRGGALYLVRMVHADGSEWFGARRFDIQGIHILGQDVQGGGWTKITPDILARIDVQGMVRDVYKTRIRWEGSR